MVEAIIFDLDGTILDNEGDWEQAFKNVLAKYQYLPKFRLDNGWIHEPGIGLSSNWRRVLTESGEYSAESERKLTFETVEEYKKIVGDLEVKLRDGVEEIVTLAKDKNLLTAISTGSTWSVVEKELEALNLILAFGTTTTGDEVLLSKPDPEIYLLTAQKMEIDPRNCLVVEDAIAGVRAAKEIEMQTACIQSGYASAEVLKSIRTDYILNDFSYLMGIIKNFE